MYIYGCIYIYINTYLNTYQNVVIKHFRVFLCISIHIAQIPAAWERLRACMRTGGV